VRARAGLIKRDEIWASLVDGLPKGQPEAGDRGLDNTPTWGRTYWGGALFFLLADLEIRKRSDGKMGLEQALRGVVAAGGNIGVEWPISRVIAAADKGTGVPVFRELYDRMKDTPAPVDLQAIWKKLGVRMHDGKVTFDDTAPLAATRRAITLGR